MDLRLFRQFEGYKIGNYILDKKKKRLQGRRYCTNADFCEHLALTHGVREIDVQAISLSCSLASYFRVPCQGRFDFHQ